jgi:ADP-L-glycero-D-manno-heptose 6-epimerase
MVKKMFLVTGGAGFIGSNIIASLNDSGMSDIIVNDRLLDDDLKWHNLQKKSYVDIVSPADLMKCLQGKKLDAVIHMGAISDTTETNEELLIENNLNLSIRLLEWCTHNKVPFIYASSAATYGDGQLGFKDDWSFNKLQQLKPLNLYGQSKHDFDLFVAKKFFNKEPLPPRWVGLKFFNVYGPNEYHKGHMMSVLAKVFQIAKNGEAVKLFKSYSPGIEDGQQRRDFIYIDDVVSVMRWFLEKSSVNGIFNIGTGKASSFREMTMSLFNSLKLPVNIEYIDMPESIQSQYQYFTQSSIENLIQAGYHCNFLSLDASVNRYVHGYLNRTNKYR